MAIPKSVPGPLTPERIDHAFAAWAQAIRGHIAAGLSPFDPDDKGKTLRDHAKAYGGTITNEADLDLVRHCFDLGGLANLIMRAKAQAPAPK